MRHAQGHSGDLYASYLGQVRLAWEVCMTASSTRYARKAEIIRAIQAAKACGLDVAGIEVGPAGGIRIMESRAIPSPANDFDRWESQL